MIDYTLQKKAKQLSLHKQDSQEIQTETNWDKIMHLKCEQLTSCFWKNFERFDIENWLVWLVLD